MHVKDIPFVLYREFSDAYCTGEEWEFTAKGIYTNGRRYRIRRLDDTNVVVGFQGAIGVSAAYGPSETVIFSLWPCIPKGTDMIFEPEPAVMVTAGAIQEGVWAWGKGNLMQETLWVRMPAERFDATRPSLKLAAKILLRAHELARAVQSEHPAY